MSFLPTLNIFFFSDPLLILTPTVLFRTQRRPFLELPTFSFRPTKALLTPTALFQHRKAFFLITARTGSGRARCNPSSQIPHLDLFCYLEKQEQPLRISTCHSTYPRPTLLPAPNARSSECAAYSSVLVIVDVVVVEVTVIMCAGMD